MSSTGYLQVHAYTSSAQIPLQDTAVTITDQSGSAIAMGLTNRSGLLDTPVSIPVPDTSAGQSPNTGLIPYATLNLYAKCKQYEEIYVKDIQVFPDTITVPGFPPLCSEQHDALLMEFLHVCSPP